MKKKIFKMPALLAMTMMLSATAITSCNNSDDYNDATSEDSLHNDAMPMDTGSGMMMNSDTSSMMNGTDTSMMNRSGAAPMDSMHSHN